MRIFQQHIFEPIRFAPSFGRAATLSIRGLALASVALTATFPGTGIVAAQQDSAQVDDGTPPSDAQADDFSTDIQTLQDEISDSTQIDAALRESRQKVATLLQQSDAAARAGNMSQAEALLDQARQAVNADDVITLNRVTLARVAFDIRRGDLSAASALLDQVSSAAKLTEKDRVRIEALKSRIAAATTDAQRRAVIAEITTLADEAAINLAREEARRDPLNFSIRLLLGDLLRKAGQMEEAGQIAEQLASDPATQGNADIRQRAILLIVRVSVDRGDFGAARAAVERLRASPDTPQKAARLADIEQRIARALSRNAERVAADARKAHERAEKQRAAAEKARVAAENARIGLEIASIEPLASDQALARSQALYEANPGNEKIAGFYARVLAREWRWAEAETVYLAMLGPEDAAAGPILVEKSSAVLGLVDLYNRTNRVAKADIWLTRLEQASAGSGDAANDRTAVLRSRINAQLRPNQFSGSITVSAGNNSNVGAPLDDNELDDFLVTNERSSFVGLDARLRYDRVVSDNGDRLRLQARIEGRPYLEVQGFDRMSYDINGGYVYLLPGTKSEFQFLAGHKSRFVDYESYRRTVYGLLNATTDFSRRVTTSATFTLEGNDDDNRDRDGVAYDGDARLRYKLSDTTALLFGLDARYEDARLKSESRGNVGATIGVRQDFSLGGMTGFYAAASYSPSYTRYGAPIPSGTGAGLTRKDTTQRFRFDIGRDITPEWRINVNASYTSRGSNIAGKDDSATQVMLSVTRLFSNQ